MWTNALFCFNLRFLSWNKTKTKEFKHNFVFYWVFRLCFMNHKILKCKDKTLDSKKVLVYMCNKKQGVVWKEKHVKMATKLTWIFNSGRVCTTFFPINSVSIMQWFIYFLQTQNCDSSWFVFFFKRPPPFPHIAVHSSPPLPEMCLILELIKAVNWSVL